MNNPKVSVIMSVYNCEKYIKESIDSILSQNFSDFEFIIINDGSTDRSKEILESYKDERIRLFNNQNKGLTKSLNEAIGYSRGEYIARMDADDISLPKRFEKQINFLESNLDYVMCGTWAEFIDEEGVYLRDYERPVTDSEIKKEILFHNPFIHPSMMIRKSVFSTVGNYKVSFKHIEDYELWSRIVFKYKTANIPEKLFKYRIHKKQITNKNNLIMRIRGIFVRILVLFRFIFRF